MKRVEASFTIIVLCQSVRRAHIKKDNTFEAILRKLFKSLFNQNPTSFKINPLMRQQIFDIVVLALTTCFIDLALRQSGCSNIKFQVLAPTMLSSNDLASPILSRSYGDTSFVGQVT